MKITNCKRIPYGVLSFSEMIEGKKNPTEILDPTVRTDHNKKYPVSTNSTDPTAILKYAGLVFIGGPRTAGKSTILDAIEDFYKRHRGYVEYSICRSYTTGSARPNEVLYGNPTHILCSDSKFLELCNQEQFEITYEVAGKRYGFLNSELETSSYSGIKFATTSSPEVFDNIILPGATKVLILIPEVDIVNRVKSRIEDTSKRDDPSTLLNLVQKSNKDFRQAALYSDSVIYFPNAENSKFEGTTALGIEGYHKKAILGLIEASRIWVMGTISKAVVLDNYLCLDAEQQKNLMDPTDPTKLRDFLREARNNTHKTYITELESAIITDSDSRENDYALVSDDGTLSQFTFAQQYYFFKYLLKATRVNRIKTEFGVELNLEYDLSENGKSIGDTGSYDKIIRQIFTNNNPKLVNNILKEYITFLGRRQTMEIPRVEPIGSSYKITYGLTDDLTLPHSLVINLPTLNDKYNK